MSGGSRLANPQHLEILNRGRYICNQWREDNPEVKPDLRASYLREAKLQEYDLRECDLRGAVMLGAFMTDCDLRGADLSYADLRFCDLSGAKMTGVRLQESKGVTAEIRRRTQSATEWKKRGPAAAAALILAFGGYWYAGSLGGADSLDLWDRVQELWAGEAGAAETEPAAARLGGAPVEDLLSEDIERRLGEVEFTGWKVEAVYRVEATLVVRTDKDVLSEAQYLPTLAATCGALAAAERSLLPDSIRVTDQAEQAGWSFASPENCAELIRTSPAVMRMAIAAETRLFRAN